MAGFKFSFCPNCGAKDTIKEGNIAWHCKNCNFVLYNNIAAAVGVIIQNNDKVLFEVRQKEPKRGFFALPGGFVAPQESAELAITRETKEELGLDIKNVKYLCSFSNDYPYKNVNYKTLDLFFTACSVAPIETQKLDLQKTEVQKVEWHSIKTQKDIDNLPLAFESSKKALGVFLAKFSR